MYESENFVKIVIIVDVVTRENQKFGKMALTISFTLNVTGEVLGEFDQWSVFFASGRLLGSTNV